MEKEKSDKLIKISSKRIAVLTSGGDAPGMNTAIGAIWKASKHFGHKVFLVRNGYFGLVHNDFFEPTEAEIDAFKNTSGTFIYSYRLPEFANDSVCDKAVKNLKQKKIDVLVVIGGDGSYKGAEKLSKKGIKIICLPGTIDNDVASSEFTIGFFSALELISNTISAISSTCNSHDRIGILEVMGRYCGDLAIYAGVVNDVDLVITNKNIMSLKEIINHLEKAFAVSENKRSAIIVITERIYDGNDGRMTLKELGNGLEKAFNKKCNVDVAGYMQRGCLPNTTEKLLTKLMAFQLVENINADKYNCTIGYIGGKIVSVPISKSINMKKDNHLKLLDYLNKMSVK